MTASINLKDRQQPHIDDEVSLVLQGRGVVWPPEASG